MLKVIQTKLVNFSKRHYRDMQRKLIISKIGRYRDIEGWLSEPEAMALYRFATRVPSGGTIVEIGSWKGKSTYCLARGLRSGRVVVIDPFNAAGEKESVEEFQRKRGDIPLLDQFTKQMSNLRVLNKLEILEGYSNQFVGRVAQVNLLFIDGDHSKEGCDFDFLNYSPRILSGGYLLLHDFYPSRKELGPTWVVENRIQQSQAFRHVDLIDSLWICQKL